LLAAGHLLLERCKALVLEQSAITDGSVDTLPPRRSLPAAAVHHVSSGEEASGPAKDAVVAQKTFSNDNPGPADELSRSDILSGAQKPEPAEAFAAQQCSDAAELSLAATPAASFVSAASSFYVSWFQVFARAMVRHLRSSSRFEAESSTGAFDALPAKSVPKRASIVPRSGSGAFQLFRQSTDNVGDVFLTTSPKHWAQCLTLHSFHIFRRFQPEEFFRAPFPAWQAKPERLRRLLVPNIVANTEFFNRIKDFFVGCIFRNDAAHRKRALVHVIDIAHCMKQLNNFDGMFSAMSALNSVGVFRLKKLWQSISTPEYEGKLSELRVLMESRNKYANYTEALRCASPPKLPYVGHFLGSLFMQSERHPKVTEFKTMMNCDSAARMFFLHCC
jgi:hypothetical protein